MTLIEWFSGNWCTSLACILTLVCLVVSDQVCPTLNALEANTAAWADTAEYPATLRKGVANVFKKRRTKHEHLVQPSSFMLNPVTFKMHVELECKP